jgi:hypothetical protein
MQSTLRNLSLPPEPAASQDLSRPSAFPRSQGMATLGEQALKEHGHLFQDRTQAEVFDLLKWAAPPLQFLEGFPPPLNNMLHYGMAHTISRLLSLELDKTSDALNMAGRRGSYSVRLAAILGFASTDADSFTVDGTFDPDESTGYMPLSARSIRTHRSCA